MYAMLLGIAGGALGVGLGVKAGTKLDNSMSPEEKATINKITKPIRLEGLKYDEPESPDEPEDPTCQV